MATIVLLFLCFQAGPLRSRRIHATLNELLHSAFWISLYTARFEYPYPQRVLNILLHSAFWISFYTARFEYPFTQRVLNVLLHVHATRLMSWKFKPSLGELNYTYKLRKLSFYLQIEKTRTQAPRKAAQFLLLNNFSAVQRTGDQRRRYCPLRGGFHETSDS